MRIVMSRRESVGSGSSSPSPLIAVALTIVSGGDHLRADGRRSARGACTPISSTPLSDGWALQELTVKATPLVLIAVGLSLCYRSNIWNIGAEGQFVMGAIFGGAVADRDARRRERPVGSARDAAGGHARRRALRADPRDPARRASASTRS